jgi:hypothetical protein
MTTRKKIDPANPLGLEPYNGMAITNVAADIKNAGGGLGKVLEVDPRLAADLAGVQIGDTRYAVLRMDCVGHNHKPAKGDEGTLTIVPAFHVTDFALTDSKEARDLIAKQIEHIAKLRADAAEIPGQGRLTDPVDPVDPGGGGE